MAKYEIIDHGYMDCQYFQGCGTAFTDYEQVVTGCGDSPFEAYRDAVNCIYQAEDSDKVDKLRLPKNPRGISKRDRRPKPETEYEEDDEGNEYEVETDYDNEVCYY